ncbi:beta-lactamase-like protein [Cladorrhinum sp. PSN332]|nr:beta-lactamase-like protein [Cladorrhinum sp. PSN332]
MNTMFTLPLLSLLLLTIGVAAHSSPRPPAAKLTIPRGSPARLSIIDSTLRMEKLNASGLTTPPIPGFQYLPTLPSWAFLIESTTPGTNKKAIFDLGFPPNANESFAPSRYKLMIGRALPVKVDKHVSEILVEHNISLDSINAIIWSHSHSDHIGDPKTFPPSTSLVVGPGFAEEFLPSYPTDPESSIPQDIFDGGRRLVELAPADFPLTIGNLPANDFFGDGSLYILDTPGHMVGHLAALVRTTTGPDTFVFLAGDLIHHGGELRPSDSPFNNQIPHNVKSLYDCPFHPHPHESKSSSKNKNKNENKKFCGKDKCPSKKEFESLTSSIGRDPRGPALLPVLYHNFTQTMQSIERSKGFDNQDNIWYLYAHDPYLLAEYGVGVKLFPRTANDWFKKGWREKTHWRFLEDFVFGAVNLTRGGSSCF